MESRKQAWATDYEVYTIGLSMTTDGSGDPTLLEESGFASVSRTAVGRYRCVLTDKWKRLISAIPTIKLSEDADVQAHVYGHSVGASTPYIDIEVRETARASLLKLQAGTIFHALVGTAVSTTDASDTPTAVALANAIKAACNAHIASAASAGVDGAHHAIDSSNGVSSADATDEASAITLANEIKADYNTHRASTSYHATADATNVVSSADATDAASLYTLLNEIKTDYNAHIAAGLATACNVVSGEIHLISLVSRRA